MKIQIGTVSYRVHFSDEQLYFNKRPVNSICCHDRRQVWVSAVLDARTLARVLRKVEVQICAFHMPATHPNGGSGGPGRPGGSPKGGLMPRGSGSGHRQVGTPRLAGPNGTEGADPTSAPMEAAMPRADRHADHHAEAGHSRIDPRINPRWHADAAIEQPAGVDALDHRHRHRHRQRLHVVEAPPSGDRDIGECDPVDVREAGDRRIPDEREIPGSGGRDDARHRLRQHVSSLRAGLYRLSNHATETARRSPDADLARLGREASDGGDGGDGDEITAFVVGALERLRDAVGADGLVCEVVSPGGDCSVTWQVSVDGLRCTRTATHQLRDLLAEDDSVYVPSLVRTDRIDPFQRFRWLSEGVRSLLVIGVPPTSEQGWRTSVALTRAVDRWTWDVEAIHLCQLVGQTVSSLSVAVTTPPARLKRHRDDTAEAEAMSA